MPISVTCGACQKNVQVKDEYAGQRIKCPGCGKGLTISAAAAAEEAPAPTEKKSKRKKKRSGKSRSSEPIFSMMGIEFTAGKLAVTAGSLVMMIGVIVLLFVFTPLGGWFSNAPEVRIVDVYTAVTALRGTDVAEHVLQKGSVSYVIPGPRKLLITRADPNGGYLLVKFKVSKNDVLQFMNNTRGTIHVYPHHFQLQASEEKIMPMLVTDQNEASEVGYNFGFNPPKSGNATATLRSYLGPKAESWTHDGETTENDDKIQFKGKHGMQVSIQTGSQRLDGREDNDTLKDLTGASSRGLKDSGIFGGPSGYVKVTWDQQSIGWLVGADLEQPNDLSASWEITCIYPRPKNATKELTLIVLDKPRTIKLP